MSQDVYQALSQLAAALSNPTRLRALHFLFQAPRSIEGLADLLGESEANTAVHMKSLRNAGLVRPHRQGKYVIQEVSEPCVLQLFMALRDAGEQLSPVMRMLDDNTDESASPLTPDELARLPSVRNVVLLDLRPETEYALGHLPGARSVPFQALPERMKALPARRRILAYCRGKYCPNARRGVALMREAGLRAERLRFGVPEWRAQGLALEAAATA